MIIKRKKIIGALSLALVCGIIGIVVIHNMYTSSKELPKEYLINKNKSKTRLSVLIDALGRIDFSNADAEKFFSEGIINPYTLNYLKGLEWRFGKENQTFDSHFEKVCNYLRTQVEIKEPDALCALYKKFIEYEVSLEEKFGAFEPASNANEALAVLTKVQNYRREFFGKDIADALFEAEVKTQEYSIRRSAIVTDPDLYGAEKLAMLDDLNRGMWGDEASLIDSLPMMNDRYNKYQESKLIYARDMREMGAEEKKGFDNSLRKKYFPPDVVAKFDEIDRQTEELKKKEEQYYALEQKIRNDPSISDHEREQKIIDLQKELFGKEGWTAFRRREAIKKGSAYEQ